jgi:hypothetical protein
VQFLRRNWVGLMFCTLGLLVLILVPFEWHRQHAYRAAATCPASAPAYGCRWQRLAEVAAVSVHHESHGAVNREVAFLAGSDHYYAHFSGDRLGPGVVRPGQMVSVEVWHHKVTAMSVGPETYRSFYIQSVPWLILFLAPLLIVMGVVMIATGVAGTSVRR